MDRVERRTIQIKEEAARLEEERLAAARAEIPAPAFQMPLDQAGIKEHVFNILIEAGFENVGDLMMSLKTDSNKVLGLAGVGPKAMQNIEEALALLTFPEPEPEVEAVAVAEPEVPATAEAPVVEALPEPEALVIEGEEPAKPDTAKTKPEEESEDEFAKDGVSLDELFTMKPEIFQNRTEGGEQESEESKKGKKKGKKKGVALEFDESLGEVVGRKKHKRDDGTWSDEG